MTTHLCLMCNVEKDEEEFHRDSQRKSGRRPYCKPCINEKRRGYRSPNANVNNRKWKTTTRAEKYKRNPRKYLWDTAKVRAKKNGTPFTITVDDIPNTKICPITYRYMNVLENDSEDGMSLDRIDNTKGYVPGNVWIISRKANRLKSDGDIKMFKRILEYMEGHLGE